MNFDTLPESGRTIYINHLDCGDRKARLGITEKGGAYLYHCFNCGKKGKIPSTYARRVWNKHAPKDKYHPDVLTLPKDAEFELDMFPAPERIWLMKYGITREDCRRFHICYSPHLKRVVLPIMDEDGVVMYTARSMTELPKYLTSKRNGVHRPTLYIKGDDSTLVICEDMISAIKVAKTGVSSMAQMGARVDVEGILQLKPKRVLIFLDDDNADVKKIQTKLKTILGVLGFKVQIIRSGGKNPKDYSLTQLREMLCLGH